MFKQIALALFAVSANAVLLQDVDGWEDCDYEVCSLDGMECKIPIPQASADLVKEIGEVLLMDDQQWEDIENSTGETIVDDIVNVAEEIHQHKLSRKEAHKLSSAARQVILNHHDDSWWATRLTESVEEGGDAE